MDGFIISLHQDEDLESKYWAGNSIVSNINDAQFIPDVVTARRSAGALQGQYVDSVVTVHPAFKGIQLKSALNVAASI